MPADAKSHCLTERQLLVSASEVEHIAYGWIMPFIILFGVVGNLTNLTVLLAPGQKTRSNVLLAALAIADIAFLLLMLPHSLAHYIFNNTFRHLYYLLKTHLIAFTNWASAAAIWDPLSVRKHRASRTHQLICGIVFTTGLLTFYNHFSHYTIINSDFCNGTQIHSISLPVASDNWPTNITNPYPHWTRVYVRVSPYINAILVVFLPTVGLGISNILLIRTIRKRKEFLERSASSRIRKATNTDEVNLMNHRPTTCSDGKKKSGSPGISVPSAAQMRIEMRITLTVCAIVTAFTITHTPSAIVILMMENRHRGQQIEGYLVYLMTVTTIMVAIGKSINFILFCLSSASFRQRLLSITKARVSKKGGSSTRCATLSIDTDRRATIDLSL